MMTHHAADGRRAVVRPARAPGDAPAVPVLEEGGRVLPVVVTPVRPRGRVVGGVGTAEATGLPAVDVVRDLRGGTARSVRAVAGDPRRGAAAVDPVAAVGVRVAAAVDPRRGAAAVDPVAAAVAVLRAQVANPGAQVAGQGAPVAGQGVVRAVRAVPGATVDAPGPAVTTDGRRVEIAVRRPELPGEVRVPAAQRDGGTLIRPDASVRRASGAAGGVTKAGVRQGAARRFPDLVVRRDRGAVVTGRGAAVTGRGAAVTGRGAAVTGRGAAVTGRGAARGETVVAGAMPPPRGVPTGRLAARPTPTGPRPGHHGRPRSGSTRASPVLRRPRGRRPAAAVDRCVSRFRN